MTNLVEQKEYYRLVYWKSAVSGLLSGSLISFFTLSNSLPYMIVGGLIGVAHSQINTYILRNIILK
jgi:hypothetical protein